MKRASRQFGILFLAVLACCLAWGFRTLAARPAAGEVFALTGITDNNNKSVEWEQLSDTVYRVTSDSALSSATITASVPTDVSKEMVSARCGLDEGTAISLRNKSGVLKITSNGVNMNFARVCTITINYQGQEYRYQIIIGSTRDYQITAPTYEFGAVYLLDPEGNYLQDENGMELMLPVSTPADRVRSLTFTADQSPYLSVQMDRELERSTTSDTAMIARWMMVGENYISLNGGDMIRVDGFNNEQGDANTSGDQPEGQSQGFRSPVLTLQPGLNVLETVYRGGIMSPLNSDTGMHGGSTVRGGVILIDYQGGPAEPFPAGSSTGLKYVEAAQFSAVTTVPLTRYTAVLREEGWRIALPETFREGYENIIVGLVPEDPAATLEILADEADGVYEFGSPLSMYHTVHVGNTASVLRVQVTAPDGTRKVQEIALSRLSADCRAEKLQFNGTELRDYTSREVLEDCDLSKTSYLLLPREGMSLDLTVAPKATLWLDGKQVEGFTENEDGKRRYQDVAVTAEDPFVTTIRVLAEDEVNYQEWYFVHMDAGGNSLLFQGVSQDTASYARELMARWYERSEAEQKALYSYWHVWEAFSTGTIQDGASVFDMSVHQYVQATDYGAAILELVMLGEDPYNFKGVDYVAGLDTQKMENGTYGGYANNVFALLGYKAAGATDRITQTLVNQVKKEALTSSSIDIRGWAAAALQGIVPEEELVPVMASLKDLQNDQGIWGNIFTNGCVLVGIAGTGVTPAYYDLGDSTLLDIMKDHNMHDGAFTFGAQDVWAKDMVIGLGDMMQGSSVWNRAALTVEKYEALLAEARKALNKGGDTAALQQAYDTARTGWDSADRTGLAAGDIVPGTEGQNLGKAYYGLYQALVQYDPSFKEMNFVFVTASGVPTGDAGEVQKTEIGEGTITAIPAQIYKGKAVRPAFTVTVNGTVLTAGTDYTAAYTGNNAIGMAAVTVTGTGDYTGTLSRTFKISPAQTTGVKFSAAKADSLKVSWSKVTGADGYQIYRSASKSGTYTKVKTITGADTKSWTNKSLTAGKTWYYKVRAYKKSGGTTYSGAYSSVVTATTLPAVPGSVKAGTAKTTSLKVSWAKVSGASGYRIYRASSKNGTYRKVKTITGGSTKSWTNKSLTAGKTYYYKVKAYKKLGGTTYWGSASGSKKGTTLPKTPALTVKSGKTKTAALTWKKVSNASGYVIYRAASKNGKYSKVKTITKASAVKYTNTKLKKGKTYYYKIRAYKTVDKSKVYSAYSSPKKIKVK